MDKIRIRKFKAFREDISIILENSKNLLLYGENGAGKTSIFESLKIAFFKEKIESGLIAQTPEDLQQLKYQFWNSFNNKIDNQEFEIEINDVSYKIFDTSVYQFFLVSIDDLVVVNEINLNTLLSRFYFDFNISNICQNHYQFIQDNVNATLFSFGESVTIVIDEEDNYNIKLADTKKNIETKSELKKYFNEAKLNLIILLIILNAIIQSKETEKQKVIVLDDFITSLDASNRTFLTKYLLEKFQDTQVIILTHNISFFNLTKYIINEIIKSSDKWVFANLFEINNVHKIYWKPDNDKVSLIKDDFNALGTNISTENLEGIGNRIRKKFEVLLYEFSKLLMIGAVEDSSKILDRITNSKAIYYIGAKTASNLIDEIETVLNENNSNNLISRLKERIENYKNNDFDNFKKILKELKLYQKVTMHPMSHGVNGLPSFTVKEIEKSLSLLEKMENHLKSLIDGNVAAI